MYVIGWIVALGGLLALYLTATEGFVGTQVGYAGRILGPVSLILMGVAFVRGWRGGPLLWIALALGLAALVLVVVGRAS
jgi:hypothetical protein